MAEGIRIKFSIWVKTEKNSPKTCENKVNDAIVCSDNTQDPMSLWLIGPNQERKYHTKSKNRMRDNARSKEGRVEEKNKKENTPARTKLKERKLLRQARMSLGDGQQDIKTLFSKQPSNQSSKSVFSNKLLILNDKLKLKVKPVVKSEIKIAKSKFNHVPNLVYPTACQKGKPDLIRLIHQPKSKSGEKGSYSQDEDTDPIIPSHRITVGRRQKLARSPVSGKIKGRVQ